ncbi:hypothetical protein ACH5RR_033697 [Cinchona calisaya]|uniref:Uncharacterized protein n=1 Tax=Cinchona calisaya TaxID=153742 RepID=A0ABD2Y8Q7_9GENT
MIERVWAYYGEPLDLGVQECFIDLGKTIAKEIVAMVGRSNGGVLWYGAESYRSWKTLIDEAIDPKPKSGDTGEKMDDFYCFSRWQRQCIELTYQM